MDATIIGYDQQQPKRDFVTGNEIKGRALEITGAHGTFHLSPFSWFEFEAKVRRTLEQVSTSYGGSDGTEEAQQQGQAQGYQQGLQQGGFSGGYQPANNLPGSPSPPANQGFSQQQQQTQPGYAGPGVAPHPVGPTE